MTQSNTTHNSKDTSVVQSTQSFVKVTTLRSFVVVAVCAGFMPVFTIALIRLGQLVLSTLSFPLA